MLDHSLTRTVDPTSEPVTLDEVKLQINVVADDEDALLDSYIQTAREMVEAYSNRALLAQTYRLKLHEWPGDRIELPRPPLQSVTSIQYYDTADVLQTLSASYYSVDTDREPGVIWQDEDLEWPVTNDHKNCIIITYVAGYASVSKVPYRAKQAMLLLIAHWYRCREAVGQVGEPIALAFQSLVNSLKPGGYP